MAESVFALTDTDGLVVNVIVADADYVAELTKQLDDPHVDTGAIRFAKAYDVTGKGVAPGYRRAGNGKFTSPPPPPVPPVDPATQAERDRVAELDAFLAGLDAKLAGGSQLTQAERDRKDVILARRLPAGPPATVTTGPPASSSSPPGNAAGKP